MKIRNLLILLSLLSLPTGYLCAAAESERERVRREAQEAHDMLLIQQALLTDESGFSHEDINHAVALSLDPNKEEEEKKESANVIAARKARIPLTMRDIQKAHKTPHTPNTVIDTEEPTTKRGKSIVAIITGETVLNDEIAILIESYEKKRMKEGSIITNDVVRSIALSPDGSTIAVATFKTISLHDAEKETPIKILEGHFNLVTSLAFSPDGKHIVSGSRDNNIHQWNVKTGECLNTFPEHDTINSIAFSPNGRYIASGSKDTMVRIWKVETGEFLKLLPGHNNEITSVTFSPDSRYVASGSDDNTVRIWDVETGECLKQLHGHDDMIKSVAFSPDGQYIASGSDDNTIRIWHVETAECLKILQKHNHSVFSIAFSPDGQYIASGSSDNTIRIWHVATGECLSTLHKHHHTVSSVVFSPDGDCIISGSFDKTIHIWHISDILAAFHQKKKIKAAHKSKPTIKEKPVIPETRSEFKQEEPAIIQIQEEPPTELVQEEPLQATSNSCCQMIRQLCMVFQQLYQNQPRRALPENE